MNRIKQLREENNWTQLELSEKMDCAMSSIAMYEKEIRKPSLEVLIRLSEIFNCSIDYLLGKSDIRNPEKKQEIDANKILVGLSSQFNKLSEESQKKVKEQIELLLENEELKRKLKDK